jgi:hypothetical protein
MHHDRAGVFAKQMGAHEALESASASVDTISELTGAAAPTSSWTSSASTPPVSWELSRATPTDRRVKYALSQHFLDTVGPRP